MILERCILALMFAPHQALFAAAFLIPMEMVLDNKNPLISFNSDELKALTNNGGIEEKESYNDKLRFKDEAEQMLGIPVFLNILSMGKLLRYINTTLINCYIKINFFPFLILIISLDRQHGNLISPLRRVDSLKWSLLGFDLQKEPDFNLIRVSNKHQNAPDEDVSFESMIESAASPSKIRPLRWGKRSEHFGTSFDFFNLRTT